MKNIRELIKERVLILDGAMGTQIQMQRVPKEAFSGSEGCNEILNITSPEVIKKIHKEYIDSGANIIKTNTFGAITWVLDEYNLSDKTYEIAKAGAEAVKELKEEFSTDENPIFVAGDLGPGTKLPSLGHISYDEMYEGYKIAASGLIDGGCDLFLIETCQDPLQIKAAVHACSDSAKEKNKDVPIMVSVTIELTGTMLIGTDVATIVSIVEPLDVFSIGFNCGVGPEDVEKHVKKLSEITSLPISVHSNAGLPQNKGGETYYPMGPDEFAKRESDFLKYNGVCMLGGCCGTTPWHIKALSESLKNKKPKKSCGFQPNSVASLFEIRALKQEPAPFLMGERSNATGSKIFRTLLLNEDYDGILKVGRTQVKNGAHGIDLNVGFAGRDETKDMQKIALMYSQKLSLPIMLDSTSVISLEIGLKQIGGKPIINSVNLEDGIEKFDKICHLAKKYGAALVCLTIDEKGMAKTKQRKIEIAQRIYKRAVEKHKLNPENLIFDFLTFTVGSGDSEYFNAAIETIDAIKEYGQKYPQVSFVLGVSNISFGLDRHAREYLNSVFLHHCVIAGLSMAIVNVKNIIPYFKISEEDKKVCENLLFNNRKDGDPLFAFINHFSDKKDNVDTKNDEEFEKLSSKEKIHNLLVEGDKEGLLDILKIAKDEIEPQIIINDILINAMKEVGELFGDGKMQLPFVLQSAETMKAGVDFLTPFLPKKEKKSSATIILGTVKGDVHDVGKNLVDIILTNNGFDVINIGIKADVSDFVEAFSKNKADAIGMSGLLVKSTVIMKENLEEFKKQGIDVPVLLGGAALTDSFVEDYCTPIYDGKIFYCKGAFDGVVAMDKIEKGELISNVKNSREEKPKEIKSVATDNKSDILLYKKSKMPNRNIKIPTPPFWGRKILDLDVSELAYDWVKYKVLFSQRWGYSTKGKSIEDIEKQRKDELWPLFNELKKEFNEKNIFKPTMIYGYYPCRSDKNTLLIFDEKEGWNNASDVNTESLEKLNPKYKFEFPRQKKEPYRALSDFFCSNRHDVVALTCVSSGPEFSRYEKELYEKGEYKKYYLVHGFGVELAETLAEIVHKNIRLELGIAENEGKNITDVQTSRYHGQRYSFGYASCPDVSLNRILFDMLKPEDAGIKLSETYQIHPEQSTTAIVLHHPDANYFAV